MFVQGFYEWQKRGGSGEGERVERIPHFVGMTEAGQGRKDSSGHGKRLMPLAGLWERVRFEGEDKPLYTFTVVTTASNEQLGFLHDRMPVILPNEKAIATWLGSNAELKSEEDVKKGDDVDDSWGLEVAKLLRPLQSELECYKVPTEVGKVDNSDPSFILPIEGRKDGLKAFFNKQKQPKQTSSDAASGEFQSSLTAKKEEQIYSQDSDSLMPSSSEDSQALLAAQQAEEEASMVEIAARAEQEKQDRLLAEEMQRGFAASDSALGGEDMNRSESIVNVGESSGSEPPSNEVETDDDVILGDEVGDGFGVPEGEEANDSPSSRRQKRPRSIESDRPSKHVRNSSSPSSPATHLPSLPPSDRFSPDPFNPPLSPPRPRDGYSRRLSPASGGGIHVNTRRGKSRGKPHDPFPQAPPHTWKSPPKKERGPIDDMLEKQRQVAERERREEARAWRELTPTRDAPERAKGKGGDSPGKKPAVKGNSKNTTSPGKDIRTFFSPQKKAPSKT